MSRGNIGHLPGYYFDEESGKYFKVEKNHQATVAKYTEGSVRRSKIQQEKIEKAARKFATKRREQVQTKNILSHPFTGGIGLRREQNILGLHTHAARSFAYAHGLKSSVRLDISRHFGWETSERCRDITTFAYDTATDGLLLGLTGLGNFLASFVAAAASRPSLQSVSEDNTFERENRPSELDPELRFLSTFNSQISSINVSRHRNLIATSFGEAELPTIFLSNLRDPQDLGSDGTLCADGATMFTPAESATIYTSSPCPFPGIEEDMFAVGMTNSATIIRSVQSGWQSPQAFKTPSDVLATEFQTPHTVALGLRNASIHIWDIRTQAGVARLRHGGSVTGIKQGHDFYSLIVGGLCNSMAHYDLRMIRDDVPSMDKKRGISKTKRRRPKTWSLPVSKPLFNFDYGNESRTYSGLDINKDHGLVAAAQDDGSIGMYLMETGEKLAWEGDLKPGIRPSSIAGCIRFFTDRRSEIGLMASRGGQIEEYLW